jgi:short-subunit dehydrogenase
MSDKNVIIIGASSGIGKELAKVFSENGFTLGLTARRLELLSQIAKELPGSSFVKHMDVSNTNEAIKAIEQLIEEMGGVQTIVINAGIGFINPDLDWEKEKNTIDVNVAGFTAMATTAMKHFIKQGFGHLVGISSISAIRGSSHAPAYSASKAFMSHYLEGLRLITLKKKIPVTITDIQPGFVDTAMAKGDKLFWVATPRTAALQIFEAIEKKKTHAYITKRWRLIAWLLKLTPTRRLAKYY